MFLARCARKAQSVVEYTVLLAIILIALVLVQATVKRGFSGNLRDAADRMGEQYSPTNTALLIERKMLNDQDINEEVNTTRTNAGTGNVGIDRYLPADLGYVPKYVGDDGVYSYTERIGQKFSTDMRQKTDSAIKELGTLQDYQDQATTWSDFPEPFVIE